MFGESIGNNVVSALMLREDVTRFVGPSNVVVFKVYVSRLRGDEWCFGEFDRRHVVGEHDRGFILRVAEVSSELTIMEQILCGSREADVFPFRGAPFSAAEYDKNGAVLALTAPTVMVWALWDCPVVGWTLWAQSEDEWISTPFGVCRECGA